jgi:glycogen debranching enzyme
MKKEDRTLTAYKESIKTLEKCSTKNGLFASCGKKGYFGVWSRDSMISLIGASPLKKPHDKFIKEQFKKSLNTLKKHQSKKGQIPNAVLNLDKKKPQVDYLSIDSNLWFVIGHYIYKKRFRDRSLFNAHKKAIEKAVLWLEYQDTGESLMLDQLPTTDWQDAFPHKYGHTINTQALYFKALNLLGKKNLAKKLKYAVNKNKDLALWNGKYYWAYRWKNHNKYRELGEWFDTLGNILAIIFDLADKNQSNKILAYIEKKKLNKPYPIRSIYPPIKKGDKEWKDYFLDCDAGKPNHYLNGGIWPFIGGLYVLALVKLKKFKQAEKELTLLAEANLMSNQFPEWIDPINKTVHGKYQAWNTGSYILAYESLKKKKVLI